MKPIAGEVKAIYSHANIFIWSYIFVNFEKKKKDVFVFLIIKRNPDIV